MTYLIGQSKEKEYSKSDLLQDFKIQAVDSIADSIFYLKRQKPLAKVGIYVGKFSELTARECVFLSLCKTRCDLMIVAVESDMSARLRSEASLCKYPTQERAFTVASLPFVDWVVTFDEESPNLMLSKINPDFIFSGLYSDDVKIYEDTLHKDKIVTVDHKFETKNLPKKKIPLKYFELEVE